MKSKVEFFGHFWEYTFSLAMLYGYAFACMPVYSHSRGEGQGPRNSTGSRGLVRDQFFHSIFSMKIWNQVNIWILHYQCILIVKMKKNYFKISNVSGKQLEFIFSFDLSSFRRCIFKKMEHILKRRH